MFIRWLIGDMGTEGDYIYGSMHITTAAVVVAVTVLLLICQRRFSKDPKKVRYLITAVSIFQLAFEVIWRLVYFFIKKAPANELWPAYPCNLAGILVPILALTNWKTGKKLFYLFALVGAVLTFAMPDGIFSNSVFVFPILKSVLQHTGILLIPLLEYEAGTFRPSLKDLGWVITGGLIHIVNSEGVSRLLGLTEDYMFFRSGLPFVIPGVPQFITLSVFALLVFALLCFLSDIKASLAFLKGLKKKQTA